ncbi:MAG: T9SS type A sorting domain-containing protein, partial [bacterium]
VVTLTQAGIDFLGTIPSNFVTIRGVEYYVTLSDGQSVITFPETDPENNPAILQVQVDQFDYQSTLQEQTYKMIAVPLALNNTDIDSVLLDDYGEYEVLPRQWRIFRWQNDAYAEHLDINAQFTPGTAFWLITRNGDGFDVENGQSVSSAQPFVITIPPGWNQIANPFAFPVHWDSISVSGNVQPPVFYDGTEYQFDITILQPWEGYFVFNLERGPVTLSVQPIEALETTEPSVYKIKNQRHQEFLLQLTATIPGTKLIDSQNFLGFREKATEGRDALDFLEPPAIGNYVRLTVMEENRQFAGNFKPLNDQGQEWELEITSTLPHPQVQVTLLESGHLPEGFRRYILDKDFHSLIPVSDNQFTVQLSKEFPVRHLKLLLGTEDFAAQNPEAIPLIPIQFALEQNYPNPFNPETSIRYQISKPAQVNLEIYNVLGQKVRTLVKEEKNAGFYSVKWDGLDVAGRSVSSGVYIYRLSAGEFTATRKLALIR